MSSLNPMRAYRRWRGTVSWVWVLGASTVGTMAAACVSRSYGIMDSPTAWAISIAVLGLQTAACRMIGRRRDVVVGRVVSIEPGIR